MRSSSIPDYDLPVQAFSLLLYFLVLLLFWISFSNCIVIYLFYTQKILFSLPQQYLCSLLQRSSFFHIIIGSSFIINSFHHIHGKQSIPIAVKKNLLYSIDFKSCFCISFRRPVYRQRSSGISQAAMTG